MLIKRQQGFEIIAMQLMFNHQAAICYQVFFLNCCSAKGKMAEKVASRLLT